MSRISTTSSAGGDSTATAAELMRFLLRLEQGRLVDPWSSRELKRLLYLTDRRIRYASHPNLKDAAFYFKSGSLCSCKPEEGFVCRKYHGNDRNFMNSVAIVEIRRRQERGGPRRTIARSASRLGAGGKTPSCHQSAPAAS